MYRTLTTLLDRLERERLDAADVIYWSCPVPVFGNLETASVASVGINPSNREFVDEKGDELSEAERRFHTLCSLGLPAWSEAESRHIEQVANACTSYFLRNPYDTWFKRLEKILAGCGSTYYGSRPSACHLDLIPYATASKWTALPSSYRRRLLEVSADTLGLLIRNSPISLLVLNGKSVVDHFELISDCVLERSEKPAWNLKRNTGNDVRGVSYCGSLSYINGVDLGRRVHVLGYNHNIQSSFGVTTGVMGSIREWVGQKRAELTYAT